VRRSLTVHHALLLAIMCRPGRHPMQHYNSAVLEQRGKSGVSM
jgi:hypothetical protein